MSEDKIKGSESDVDQAPVHREVMPCFLCRGFGWVWCDEMPSRAGHDPHDLVVDDTRYTCPDCGGSGKTRCDMTGGPCSCGAWH